MILNEYLLKKMGWVASNWDANWDANLKNINFEYLKEFKGKSYYFTKDGTKIFFIIQDFDKYIFMEMKELTVRQSYEQIKINTSAELMRLIIDNEAFLEEYKRHFRINKILKT